MVAEHDGKDSLYRAIVIDGIVAGTISIEPKADVMRKDAELGYFLLTEYWSQGIMTEATRQFCEIAFDELDIIRISSMVYSPNIASQRVLEQNGFVREGRQRNAIYKDGNFYDACLFGKLKEEQ
jgi:ribosomal-protein-alanine N-acetyltransferase